MVAVSKKCPCIRQSASVCVIDTKSQTTFLQVHDDSLGTSDLEVIVKDVMVAKPKLVDVACDGSGNQGCVFIGDGDAACRLPDATDKLGWISVYGAISVLFVWTGWTIGGTGLEVDRLWLCQLV